MNVTLHYEHSHTFAAASAEPAASASSSCQVWAVHRVVAAAASGLAQSRAQSRNDNVGQAAAYSEQEGQG